MTRLHLSSFAYTRLLIRLFLEQIVLMRNMISLIRVKNREKVKALLIGVDVGNVEQQAQMAQMSNA